MTEADAAVGRPPLARVVRTAMTQRVAGSRQPLHVPARSARGKADDPTHWLFRPHRLAGRGITAATTAASSVTSRRTASMIERVCLITTVDLPRRPGRRKGNDSAC